MVVLRDITRPDGPPASPKPAVPAHSVLKFLYRWLRLCRCISLLSKYGRLSSTASAGSASLSRCGPLYLPANGGELKPGVSRPRCVHR